MSEKVKQLPKKPRCCNQPMRAVTVALHRKRTRVGYICLRCKTFDGCLGWQHYGGGSE